MVQDFAVLHNAARRFRNVDFNAHSHDEPCREFKALVIHVQYARNGPVVPTDGIDHTQLIDHTPLGSISFQNSFSGK